MLDYDANEDIKKEMEKLDLEAQENLKKEEKKKNIKNLLWKIVGVVYLAFLILVLLGYIKLPSRCGKDKWGDVQCWDPR